ncbi:ProQ/FinO family protein [Sinorhizobium terangae]|uniref:ProQ/FinO family protein n=1 Tax=Sinorhizobium terangae TaxID=110322 RepID=UPI0024B269AF|nr:ProQ/FinO family protein [Sinorhizobium terangae]WFU49162.1 ProQ/FinO family protein [Sinorhizobium terangae]
MPGEQQPKTASVLFRHLSEKWPEAFNTRAPKPLKIGIREDIRALDHELSDHDLKRALRAYTKLERYLKSLRAGAARVDLDGNPTGNVSEADAATAQALLRVRSAKEKTMRSPELQAEPEQSRRPIAKQAPASKAKLPNRSAGVVVETKRRRLTGRRLDRR